MSRVILRTAGRAVAWVGMALLVAAAQAQTRGVAAPAAGRILLATNETNLWLADSDQDHTLLYRRGVSGPFQPSAKPFHAPLRMLALADSWLYAFTRDGGLYAYTGDEWLRAQDLPRRALPHDLTAWGPHLYALVSSPSPGALPCASLAGTQPATTRPFDAAGSPLSVVRYSYPDWQGLAACPLEVNPAAPEGLRPRLMHLRERLCLFWWRGEDRVVYAGLDAGSGQWTTVETTPAVAGLKAYWLTSIAGVPAIVAIGETVESARTVHVLRWLGAATDGGTGWRVARLSLSELPAGTSATSYRAASGFNQHIALLAEDAQGAAYVQFGRIDGTPTESTIRVSEVAAGRLGAASGPTWVQAATVALLLATLLALVLFRRPALTTHAVLPSEFALALTIQRLAGLLVDLLPFALLAAFFVGVRMDSAGRELSGWAIGTDAVAGGLPAVRTLTWWGLTVAMHTLYALTSELATGRTLGKAVIGTRVWSENGTPPRPTQVLVRNLLRAAELVPPLWILGFMVVLSRNRQRVGDIFARTVVVRRMPPPPAPTNDDAPDV